MLDPNADPARGHTYRAYTLDTSGRICGVEVVHATDDAQARKCTRSLVNYYTVELWDRARFLERFAPERPLVLIGASA